MAETKTTNPIIAFCSKPQIFLDHVCSFLTAEELVNLHVATASCLKSQPQLKTLVKASENKKVWQNLLRNDFDQNILERNLPSSRFTPKQSYLARRVILMEERAERKRHVEAEEKARAAEQAIIDKQDDYRQNAKYLHFFQEYCAPCIFFPLMVATVVWINIRLEKGDALTIECFIPMLTAISVVFCAISCMCYVNNARHPIPFNDDAFDNDDGVVRNVMHELKEDRLSRQLYALLIVIWLCAWGVLLALKAIGVIDWPPWLVFSPLWCMFFMFFFQPQFFHDAFERYPICLASWAVVYCPLLSFFVLLCLFLHGLVSCMVAMIPWFAFEGVMLIVAIKETVNDEEAVPIVIWLLTAGPAIAFEIMISLFLDKSVDTLGWATSFIPLWVILLWGILVGCFYAADHWHNNKDLCGDCC